jgi:hypothetical protein
MSLSCKRRPEGVDHFLALVSDVTERRRLEDELEDSRLHSSTSSRTAAR